jgi:hypothetical protein
MSDNTDKFNPGGTISTSTARSSQLPGTVSITNCNGQVIHNSDVGNNNRVVFTSSFTCTQGACVVGAEFTGDASSKASKNSLNFAVGDKTSSSLGKVTRIVAGPGIFVSNNGDGVVTVSLEPLKKSNQTENLNRIVWTISDNTNVTDRSMFLATGGGAGQAGVVEASGVAVRSRDGDNWVDINNTPFKIGMVDAIAIESKDVYSLFASGTTGTGQVYVATGSVASTPGTELLGVFNIWGIEGKTDVNSCAWCSDGLKYQGGDIGVNSADYPGEASGNLYAFYNTGSAVTNSLFLQFTQAASSSTYTNSTGKSSILRYTGFPSNLRVTPNTVNVPAVVELTNTGSDFRFAASNLIDAAFTNYTVLVCDVGTASIWGSTRNGKQASTWSQVYSGPSVRGIAYAGNNRWVACGYNDTIIVSTNGGNSWTASPAKWAGSNWRSVATGNGYIVIVGEQGRAVYSQDGGVTWQRAQTGTTQQLNDIAFAPRLCQFVAVGNARTIIKVAV